MEQELGEISAILDSQIKQYAITQVEQPKGSDIYETSKSIEQYIEFHYGSTELFGIRNFPVVCAEKCK